MCRVTTPRHYWNKGPCEVELILVMPVALLDRKQEHSPKLHLVQHTHLICRKWVECQAPILRQELRGGMDKHCTCGVLCICRVSERDGGFDNLWCATKFHPCIISFLFALGWYQNLQIHQYLPPCLQEDAWCKCSESLFDNARNNLSQSNPGTRDEKVY